MLLGQELRHNRQLRGAATGLAVWVLVGTFGLFWIEDHISVWDGFWFTLITITTVGYGDLDISQAGQMFAALILIGGVGTMSYTFALVVQSAITSNLAWRRRMQIRVDRSRDHTIVCGFGRMGHAVCEQLSQTEVPFVVVDADPDRVREASHLGYIAIEGCPSDDAVLTQAGIERATHLVAAVDATSENIVVSLTAAEMNSKLTIIAQAGTAADARKLKRAGATRSVSPFESGGLEIVNSIVRPNVADFLARSVHARTELALAEITIEPGSNLAGKTLQDYGRGDGSRISFVALERPGHATKVPPPGATRFKAGDLFIVAGDPVDVEVMQTAARYS